MIRNKIAIITPVYNDWATFGCLLREIDATLLNEQFEMSVTAVDDGSTQAFDPKLVNANELHNIKNLQIIHLAANLGHQRAIALGLAYIHDHSSPDLVIVMDCDGEDRPSDIIRLIEKQRHSPETIVFAHRARRSEGLLFSIFYWLYKIAFWLLSGTSISFGNFCAIPRTKLRQVVYLADIWNHFTAGIVRARLPVTLLPTLRGTRYTGKSQMRFVGLILHGLRAIAVYTDIVAVRLIIFSSVIISLVGIGFTVLFYVRYGTSLAIPGWATNVAFGLAGLFLQSLLFLTFLIFLVFTFRNNQMFIPARDYQCYIHEIENFAL